jgi:vitamin B12 transporter
MLKHFFLLIFPFILLAQDATTLSENIEEIIISAERIEYPVIKSSKTIQIIRAEEIASSGFNNIPDLLQQIAGLDVRRRGIYGMQADLYIRGGSFDQTLLLIDGIRVEDAQTGHHLLNLLPSIHLIERIEVYKGPAARSLGQNAFSGAINIVTKKAAQTDGLVTLSGGSFGLAEGEILVPFSGNHIFQAGYIRSDGYRYNTDFEALRFGLKSNFDIAGIPLQLSGNYQTRDFGANGFYARPTAKDQYEETRTGLVSLTTRIETSKGIILKPALYLRSNADHYLFVRDNPAIYENNHQTYKLGGMLNAFIPGKTGGTGFGIDVSQTILESTNLGNHQRNAVHVFGEQRMELFSGKIDVTPGVTLNHYSDFGWFAYPGIDLGWKITSDFKTYANWGYTFRIPTYTDLFYNDPVTQGNTELLPEKAASSELGFNWKLLNVALFSRNALNVIDYVKQNPTDTKDRAENIRRINTRGIEVNAQKQLGKQNFRFGYTYILDNLKDVPVYFSRYSLNSMKNQLVLSWTGENFRKVRHQLHYRWVERTNGLQYGVIDAGMDIQLHKTIQFQLFVSNILDAAYSETNLVPMPGTNFRALLTYRFN